jgi:hypothetical protein
MGSAIHITAAFGGAFGTMARLLNNCVRERRKIRVQ